MFLGDFQRLPAVSGKRGFVGAEERWWVDWSCANTRHCSYQHRWLAAEMDVWQTHFNGTIRKVKFYWNLYC